VGMRASSRGCSSERETVETRTFEEEDLSVTVSLRVPAAPQDGQAPNHCRALAPQSEQT
jgi:hypothetical protein